MNQIDTRYTVTSPLFEVIDPQGRLRVGSLDDIRPENGSLARTLETEPRSFVVFRGVALPASFCALVTGERANFTIVKEVEIQIMPVDIQNSQFSGRPIIEHAISRRKVFPSVSIVEQISTQIRIDHVCYQLSPESNLELKRLAETPVESPLSVGLTLAPRYAIYSDLTYQVPLPGIDSGTSPRIRPAA